VAHGSDFDGVIVFEIEEDPVIAAAETEARERRLQFFLHHRYGWRDSDPGSKESA
jgi:hypothetical protein